MADLRSAGRRPYLVEVGGSDVVGAVGQVMAGLELADGAARRGFMPDDVVVPSATGGTQAGLVMGLRAAGARTVVHGIAVTPRDELHAKVVAMVDALGALDGLDRLGAGDDDAIRLDDDQLGRRLRPTRPLPPKLPPASSPGPRASWSTRSTPRRRWPGSSSASGRAHSMAIGSCSGTPAARPASSNR